MGTVLDLDDGECFVDILEKSGTYGLGWAGLGWLPWLTGWVGVASLG